MKRVWNIFGVVIVFGVASLFGAALLAGRDVSPPNVREFEITRPVIAPEENAFTYYAAATNVLYWPTNATAILAKSPFDESELSELLTRNEEMVALVKRGNEQQQCFPPELSDLEEHVPYLGAFLTMAKLLSAKARYDRFKGRDAAATEDCIALLHFAGLIQRDASALAGGLVGLGVLQIALTETQSLVREGRLSNEERQQLALALVALDPLSSGFNRAIQQEVTITARTIRSIASGDLSTSGLMSLRGGEAGSARAKGRKLFYFFQPNRTTLMFATLAGEVMANAALPYAEMSGMNEKPLDLHPIVLFVRPNAVGKVLYSLMAPGIRSSLERLVRAQCVLSATRLLVACHQFRAANGMFPDTLQELVPIYLAELPRDPYDGRPFRYEASQKILYSVGSDLRDSGGSTNRLANPARSAAESALWDAEDAVFALAAHVEVRPWENPEPLPMRIREAQFGE